MNTRQATKAINEGIDLVIAGTILILVMFACAIVLYALSQVKI